MNENEKFELIRKQAEAGLLNPAEQFEAEARLACAPEREISPVVTAKDKVCEPILSFSKNGKYLFEKYSTAVFVYSMIDKKYIQVINPPKVYYNSANISANGKYVVTGEIVGRIIVWDTFLGEEKLIIENEKNKGIKKVTISLDNQYVLMNRLKRDINYLFVYDFKTGKLLYKTGMHVNEFMLSSNGKTVFISEKMKISQVDLRSGQIISVYQFEEEIENFKINNQNEIIYLAESSKSLYRKEIIGILDLYTRNFQKFKTGKMIYKFNLHPTKNYMLISEGEMGNSYANDQTTQTWDFNKNQRIDNPIERINHPLAFSPDGKLLATYLNRSIDIWDLNQNKLVDKCENALPSMFAMEGRIKSSSDGKKLAFYEFKKKIFIWNLENGQIENEINTELYLHYFTLNHDGSLLAFLNDDKNIELWDLINHSRLFLWNLENPNYFGSFIFLRKNDQELLVYTNYKKLFLRDLMSGKIVQAIDTYSGVHKNLSYNEKIKILFSNLKGYNYWWDLNWGRPIQKKKILITGDVFDGHKFSLIHKTYTDLEKMISFIFDHHYNYENGKKNGDEYHIHLIDLNKNQIVQNLKGHDKNVDFVCVDNKLRTIITANKDGDIRKWDLKTGKCIHIFNDYHTTGLAEKLLFMQTNSKKDQLRVINNKNEFYFWNLKNNQLLIKAYILDHGYLWITPPDEFAPNGWLHTNRPDLVSLIEMNKADQTNPIFIPEDNHRFQEYMQMYNDQEMVMTRLNNFERYQELLNIRLGNKERISENLMKNNPIKLLIDATPIQNMKADGNE